MSERTAWFVVDKDGTVWLRSCESSRDRAIHQFNPNCPILFQERYEKLGYTCREFRLVPVDDSTKSN